jgi:hypothetical protein
MSNTGITYLGNDEAEGTCMKCGEKFLLKTTDHGIEFFGKTSGKPPDPVPGDTYQTELHGLFCYRCGKGNPEATTLCIPFPDEPPEPMKYIGYGDAECTCLGCGEKFLLNAADIGTELVAKLSQTATGEPGELEGFYCSQCSKKPPDGSFKIRLDAVEKIPDSRTRPPPTA